MKHKRLLSVLLAACMLLSLMPAVTQPARAETYSDPVYHRVGTPEVAIFNAYNGASLSFFKREMVNHFYNAVAAGEFKKTDDSTSLLNYEVKVSDDTTYVWKRFYNSNLAYLSDKYQQLRAGFAVTRTSRSHSHHWGFLGIYSADLTSYMNTDLYLHDAVRNRYWDIADHRGFSRSAATLRNGSREWSPMGYTVNGANSRYMIISGVQQSDIRMDLYLSFVNSTLHYDGQSKTCSCGGSATGAMVSFYDEVAPVIKSVEIKNGSTACTNFKAGDTVTVVLNCSEAIRFADDSAVGKGNVCIGLMADRSTDRLYAHLVSLDNETLTFTYQVDAKDTNLYTITGIDLTRAPEGGLPLVQSSATVTLKQVYGGSANKTYAKATNPDGSGELGFTKTTSQITDMAGNALVNSVPAVSFYIDCEDPFVALTALSAQTNNSDVKEALGKTNMKPNAANYEDNSDLYLGTGDSFRLTLYMNEVVTGTNALVTTNIKDSGGNYLALNVTSSGTTSRDSVGKQYGLGASQGKVSVFYTDPVTITAGMTVDGTDGIKITGVTFTGVTDASRNAAVGAAVSPNKKYHIDTAAPSVTAEAAVQTAGVNGSFYVPFLVTDAASGVAGLPASLTFRLSNWTSSFQYAVTATSAEPSEWLAGAMGTSIPFTQTGTQQYLHIRPVATEQYAIYQNAEILFAPMDYAGNKGSTAATLTGVVLDTSKPLIQAGGSTRSYNNSTSQGTLTVTVNAADLGGIASVQYQWTAIDQTLTAETETGWLNAVGSLDGNPQSAAMTAEATVGSLELFCQRLWAKAADVAGNVSVEDLGEYSYNLKGIEYLLDYTHTPAVSASPVVTVSDLDVDGKLVFDVRKGSDTTHYVTVVDSVSGDNVFDGQWYTAALDNTDGTKFTGLVSAAGPFSGFTGNLYVTVYSGNGATITQAAEGEDITITSNAETEEIVLRVSPADNELSDVFDGTNVFSVDAATLAAITSRVTAYPWHEGDAAVSSTLEGVQVNINLGNDVNGWGYADIDWENSYIALDGARLCSIGSGSTQTVTLPASDLYTSGKNHSLGLVLARRSAPASPYQATIDGICIDATEPGTLSLGLLAMEQPGMHDYQEIGYDPTAPIYLPTEGYHTILSVEALDAAGSSIDFSSESGAEMNAGALDVIAWNTADPAAKISLSHLHLYRQEYEEYDQILWDQDEDSYPTNGKRSLVLEETTDSSGGSGFPSGILGVAADQDNVIALQIRYANGRTSDVTYLTVHPVSLSLTGTVTATPAVDESAYGPFSPYTTSGLVTTDPGTGFVTFTPAAGCNTTGLTLYCFEGWITAGGEYWTMGDFTSDQGIMTQQNDGSYLYQIPTASAEAFDSAMRAYMEDPENNPHPGRYIGIWEIFDGDPELPPDGYKNIIRDGDQPVGYYIVCARDQYGNVSYAGITKNAVIADGSAPIVTGESLTENSGAYTAAFRIYDDSLYSFGRDIDWTDQAISRPMTLTLSYDDAYASAIDAAGESLTLTADAGGGNWHWVADSPNKLGIFEVDAVLTREGVFDSDANDYETYLHGATDAYLTVTVQGVVSPKVTSAMNMTLNLAAADAHGNKSEATGVTASVTGEEPVLCAMEFRAVEMSPGIRDLALFTTFNLPVQPAESWMNRSISGYGTDWQDAFPITNDGTWEISYTDLFGTAYTKTIDTADYKGGSDSVFGVYGFDLSFSTLDYVAASEGVTITASYTGTDGDSLHIMKGSETITSYEGDRLTGRTAKAGVNGEYVVYLYGDSGWQDKVHIYLTNIVSGGPEETLWFFVDEFMEQYEAGTDGQFRGVTSRAVTVSYETSRPTSPVGSTTVTLKYGDSDTFTFQYYDAPTDFTYTITGKLSDYGISFAEPETPYVDNEAPVIDLVTVWKQQGGGFVQTNAFPGGAAAAAIQDAIADSGAAQSYDFVVQASDYSKWKVLVKSAEPASLAYADAASDTIPGVSVSGNNVLVTKEVADDFYIVVVDNAAADTAAGEDHWTCIRIPSGSYHFDTTAPEIVTQTVANGLYSKTVYLKATDKDDSGADTSGSVTLSGAGLIENTDANAAEYPYKLTFTDNSTVVVVTATDAAGNSATAGIQVAGIDDAAPVLTITWSPCFKDPSTGKLDGNNPTAGPVNTDVVAHISSNKEIAGVLVDDTDLLDKTAPEMSSWFTGMVISYTSQRITARFTEEGGTSCKLELFAPNGKSTAVTLTLNSGVIDKTAPTVIDTVTPSIHAGCAIPYAEQHSLSFDEDVYCMNDFGEEEEEDSWNGSKAKRIYNNEHPFVLTLTENEPRVLQFADKAGNLTLYTVTPAAAIDGIAPSLTLEFPDDSDATSSAVTVTVTADESCTLTASDSAVTCGALTEGAGGKWTGTLSVSKNGTFRLTAADSAGNQTSMSFTINNIDRMMPTISFVTSTVSLRQGSSADALAALLNDGVSVWDNAAVAEGSLAYDASGVRLDTAGVYAVTYTVEDTAGNEAQATRFVKVIDKDQPIITIDGVLTEENGTTGIKTGTHTLSVSGLKTEGEPYTLKLVKGIWSAGQMKRVSDGIPVGEDGSFTITGTDFYTLYIITQSRQTYRTLLFAEN